MGFNLLDEIGTLTPRQRGDVYEPAEDVTFRVTSAEYTQSQKKGTNGWKITAVALDGPYEGDEFQNTLWYTKNSAMMFLPRAASLGVTKAWLDANGGEPQVIADRMFGAIFRGDVTKEEYNKRWSNKVEPHENSYLGHDGEGDIGVIGMESDGMDEFAQPTEEQPPPQDSSDAVDLPDAPPAKPVQTAKAAPAATAAPADPAVPDDIPWDMSDTDG